MAPPEVGRVDCRPVYSPPTIDRPALRTGGLLALSQKLAIGGSRVCQLLMSKKRLVLTGPTGGGHFRWLNQDPVACCC